nr:reverse transcriptase domain, reverse transcriptase zinc-binding domain protein [Tanacetum cinerariifolium]
MKWELDEKNRSLNEEEMSIWIEARRLWVEKEREKVGGVRRCDIFLRLYHIDSSKKGKVAKKEKWVDNGWCWEWVRVRNLIGRVCKDFEELQELLHDVVIKFYCRDSWRWALKENGDFTELARKIYCWWKIRVVNAFSIEEFFSSNGNANVPSHSYRIWQAVIWTSGVSALGPLRIFSNVGIGSDRLVPCVTAVMVSASAGSHCCYVGPGTNELGMIFF